LIQHQSCKIRAYSYHIKSTIIITNTSHIIIVIPRVDNNKSTNKCTTTNRGTISSTTNFKHNKESTFDSIWNTTNTYRSNYNEYRLDYRIVRSISNYWPTRLGTTSNLTLLTYFDPNFRDVIQSMGGVMLKN
jgi:hypothetical protein